MKGRSIGPRFIAVVAIFAMAPGVVFAYIDPGSGAYMVQALFALIGAALFYIRHPIRTIRALLNRVFGRSNIQAPVPLQDDPPDLQNTHGDPSEGVVVAGSQEVQDRC